MARTIYIERPASAYGKGAGKSGVEIASEFLGEARSESRAARTGLRAGADALSSAIRVANSGTPVKKTAKVRQGLYKVQVAESHLLSALTWARVLRPVCTVA